MSQETTGAIVAGALRQCWRGEPPASALSPGEWETAVPLLLATGGAALGWWPWRGRDVPGSASIGDLRDAYRIQTLDARLHEERLTEIVVVLESAGLPLLMSKGWSVAARYPAVGLRPYGDFDLHVPPHRHAEAAAVLEAADIRTRVDLHAAVPRLEADWSALWRRSRPSGLAGTSLRVLGDEDHLTLLCTHFLEHGAWRPLWLCDIGLFVENAGPSMDWDVSPAAGPLAERLRTAVLLAHRLLGADLSGTPWSVGDAADMPEWIPRAALCSWGRGGHYSLTTRIALTSARPGTVLDGLRTRWPNAIEATIRMGASFDGAPRLPYQLLDTAARTARAVPATARLLFEKARGR